MSSFARWFLGLAALGFSCLCAYMPLEGLTPQNSWVMWGIAAICLMIAIACVPGRHGKLFGRILAGVGGAACAAYLVTEIFHPDPGGSRSSPSLGGAITMFVAWGLPALWYAFTGVIPGMGRLGEVAHAITHPHNDEPGDEEEEVFTPKSPSEGPKPALH